MNRLGTRTTYLLAGLGALALTAFVFAFSSGAETADERAFVPPIR